MLPKAHKLSSSVEFSAVMRQGRKAGSRTLVVHVASRKTEPVIPSVRKGGPRFGLVVSKTVGNAVTRHAVSRKLRNIAYKRRGDIDRNLDIVIRALPPSGKASTHQLESDFHKALNKACRRPSKSNQSDVV